MSPDFKKIAAREIEEFKAEYRERFPERDPEAITDEDLLREVMNTVGKPGRLGEQIKCVVSRLDAHRGLGREHRDARSGRPRLLDAAALRAGRRARAAAHHLRDRRERHVPGRVRRGLRGAVLVHPGRAGDQHAGACPRRRRACARSTERVAREITFPRLTGYRYELAGERLDASSSTTAPAWRSRPPTCRPRSRTRRSSARQSSTRSTSSRRSAPRRSTSCSPSWSTSSTSAATTGDAQAVALPADPRGVAAAGCSECLTCKDDCFPQMLLLVEYAHNAADKIYRAIVDGDARARSCCMPILQPYDTVGSTSYVDFDTTRPVMGDRPRQVPHLARGLRHRLVGAEDGAGARGHGRGRELREEPQPRLLHPVHLRRRGAQLHPRLHRAAARRRRRRQRAAQPHHRGLGRGQDGEGRQGARRRAPSGCRPSTTTAASAAGASSRSATRGTRRTRSGPPSRLAGCLHDWQPRHRLGRGELEPHYRLHQGEPWLCALLGRAHGVAAAGDGSGAVRRAASRSPRTRICSRSRCTG